ncbi:peptidase inhibitor family I36 protein [Amycolatopsis taiwanensis]|uniref:Peptidase inhibitor family I36 n=1 Tax=Amycolatopsis taiwanensis TaxID=342230 RepID=A0A9W6QZD0_9PSEU|nr:peptidase inhibitor family I36 protein [Amycolatopsis taiwanensis]GLY65625.1 hypothetical protein Atai01_22440 [Amycolatopsis taiwanensis]
MRTRQIGIAGAVAALALAGSALAAPAALADVSPHCQQSGYCLFSGAGFTGTRVTVSSGTGCHPVSDLGLPVARSAARGFGDGAALTLYSDTQCTTSIGTVFTELPDISAASYRLTPLPG